ncbi:MAG: 4Fe-4S dicluster domain-containing protein [Desulfobacterales bacterium]
MSKGFFIDTTLCTACRGCQVACKQWHDLPAEHTVNTGSFQNPPDLSFDTYKLVRMTEDVIDGRLHWLFFPEQCRHCIEPPCLESAGEPSAIFKDENTGAVLFTANTADLSADDIIGSCPYNIPRKNDAGILAKCDMCNDRVINGLLPACVKTCPTKGIWTSGTGRMKALAEKHLETAKRNSQSRSSGKDSVRVIYLTGFDPSEYHKSTMAGPGLLWHEHQLIMEHEVPHNLFVKLLFHIRMSMMGSKDAREFLKQDISPFKEIFSYILLLHTKSGKSKLFVCQK